MWLATSCDFEFKISVPTPFILMLRPRSGAQQWISREEYKLTPSVPVVEFTDTYGNLCQRLVAPSGHFRIHTAAQVMTSDVVDKAPGAPFVDIHRLPDEVVEITAGKLLGYDQVATIENWLRETISYIPGSGDNPLSAIGVNQKQSGVCRDLAHLGIALCRSISIPARLVVGYNYGLVPMDMHAWFEAYVGGRWYAFDATQEEMTPGYVAIGYGRDAADVAVYNQFGPSVYHISQNVSVDLVEVEE